MYRRRPIQREAARRVVLADLQPRVWEVEGLPFGPLLTVVNTHPDGPEAGQTVIIDLPPGWSMPDSHWLTCPEEFYVLSGDLTEGDAVYRPGQYVFRPGGMTIGPRSTRSGCRLYAWHDGPYGIGTGTPPSDLVDDRPPTTVDCADLSLRRAIVGALSEGGRDVSAYTHSPVEAAVTTLRTAEETGDDVVLMWQPPGFDMSVLSVHEGTEEAFMIGDGWTSSDAMNVYPGGTYLCWEPGVIHGPVKGWEINVLTKHYGGYTNPAVPIACCAMDVGNGYVTRA